MIIRAPMWARPIFPLYFNIGSRGFTLVTPWHHVPLFGIYWNRWPMTIIWRYKALCGSMFT